MIELWLSCPSWSWSSVAAATPIDKAAKIRLTTFKIFSESQLLKTLRFGKPSQFTCYIYKETCRSSHDRRLLDDILMSRRRLRCCWRSAFECTNGHYGEMTLEVDFSFHRSRSVEVVKCTMAVPLPTPSDIYEDIERAEVKSKSVGMNVISM